MVDTSDSISKTIAQQFCNVIKNPHDGVWKDLRRCEAIIRDLCKEDRFAANILSIALREGIVDAIGIIEPNIPVQIQLGRYVDILSKNYGITENAASWAVHVWAKVFGLRFDITSSIDEQVSTQYTYLNEDPFWMLIIDAQEIAEHGVEVAGYVRQGSLRVGSSVDIVGINRTISAEVAGLKVDHRLVSGVTWGDSDVKILLAAVNLRDINVRKQVVCHPGTFSQADLCSFLGLSSSSFLHKNDTDIRNQTEFHRGRVIVVTSGVGDMFYKTTTVANIGTGLAHLGKMVCLVDANDCGLCNLDIVLGLEMRIVYDIVDLIKGSCKLRSALIKHPWRDCLYLLPAAQIKKKDLVTPEQMKDLCDHLAAAFDFVIIDSPAGIEHGFRNAIAGADEAIIVTTPEVSAMRDADRIISMLEIYELHNPQLVINRIRPDMVTRGDIMDIDDIIEMLSIELIGVVPDDKYIAMSTIKGTPVILEDKSKAGLEYKNITRRILGEKVPIISPEQPTILKRIRSILNP